MSVTISITVEDPDTQLDTYDVIRVYRANTASGSYSLLGTATLVTLTYLYSYTDSSGDLNKFYKYSYYNSSTTAESAQSAPFRPDGSSRLKIRQRLLDDYKAGRLLTASAGSTTSVTTTDYRVKYSGASANRGIGTWVLPTTGAEAGNARRVTALTTGGVFSVDPEWDTGPTAEDEFEWHTLTDPYDINACINKGLKRYYYLDRVPIIGVSNQEEYSLSNLPWLTDRRHIHDIRYYPNRSGGVDDGLDVPWGTEGRWWNARQDEGIVHLQISPTIDSTYCLYLVVSRPMPELWTDNSAPPYPFDEEYAAALAYDEVLKLLTRPSGGTAVEIATWKGVRRDHSRGTLRKLAYRNKLDYDKGLPQFLTPPVVPQPYQAR